MSNKKISIIGAGNLGISLAKGIVQKDLLPASNVILTRRHLESIEWMRKDGYTITDQNVDAVSKSDVVILCVQPQQLNMLMEEIKDSISRDQTVVSVITGVSLEELGKYFENDVTIIRAMPNTAIAIGESMTCLASENGSAGKMAFVESVFNSLGETMVIDERLMQAATVLGASGIAFFMRYLRAATQGGIQMGFHPEEAQKIAVQTARGAASLVILDKSHPEVEIDKVTTPQGCTIEGLNEMEHQGFSSALIKGLMTSFHKIKLINQ